MDTESPRSRSLKCWDALDSLHHLITNDFGPANSSPDFAPTTDFATFLVNSGFGPNCSSEMRDFWVKELQKNYWGEDGRKRIRMATINLRDRDGLHLRLGDVRCPVLWLHVSHALFCFMARTTRVANCISPDTHPTCAITLNPIVFPRIRQAAFLSKFLQHVI